MDSWQMRRLDACTSASLSRSQMGAPQDPAPARSLPNSQEVTARMLSDGLDLPDVAPGVNLSVGSRQMWHLA